MPDQYPYLCSKCHNALSYTEEYEGGPVYIEPCQSCVEGDYDDGYSQEEK